MVDYDQHLLVLTAGLNVGVTRKIRLSRSAEHSAHRKTSSLSSPGKLPKFARKWQKNTSTTGIPEGRIQFKQAGGRKVLYTFLDFISLLPRPTIYLEIFVFENQWDLNLQIILPPLSKSIGFRFSPRISSSKLKHKVKGTLEGFPENLSSQNNKISFCFQLYPTHTQFWSLYWTELSLAYHLDAAKRNHTHWPKNVGFNSFWSIWSKHSPDTTGTPPQDTTFRICPWCPWCGGSWEAVSMLQSNYPSSAVGGWLGRKGARRRNIGEQMTRRLARSCPAANLWCWTPVLRWLLGTLRYF